MTGVVGYKVLYSEVTGGGSRDIHDASMVMVPLAERSVLVNELKKWTRYKIWVSVHGGEVGEVGLLSDAVLVQTLEDGRF